LLSAGVCSWGGTCCCGCCWERGVVNEPATGVAMAMGGVVVEG
jgi:hypothetical protein